MSKPLILTGITPSGILHLGNYLGAIKPCLDYQSDPNVDLQVFVADWHSLVKCFDPKVRQDYIYENTACWLALGIDPSKTCIYRQSDIPEITELTWILTSITAKGLLNRAHAYKACVTDNLTANNDPDKGLTMGLFSYPILMAADILLFNANQVPVGQDQLQHIEIARDIAIRFNHLYGDTFTLPEGLVDKNIPTLPGTDGRKMSKSYGNTIPIFLPEAKLRKAIMKIKTNSQLPSEPKDPDNCTLMTLYKAFATPDEITTLTGHYQTGIGWGDVKQEVFRVLNQQLAEPRERYEALISEPKQIDAILATGSDQLRDQSTQFLTKIKRLIGV